MAAFALTVLAIGAAWWWLGAPIAVPPSPLATGEKLYCVSYAPFRGGASPLVAGTIVDPRQIDADLAILANYTDCVRNYSTEFGLDQVPEIARRHGLKVLQGAWLSNKPEKNRRQIATVIALAKQYPEVISAVLVGNEVLLRGDMSVTDLMAAIRQVKAQVPMPVSYADVWEYWLRYPDVQNAVDFVTIHILPYWEDFPLPAALAAAHVEAIREKVAAAIPNREIVVGEIGWPSAGRMREAARPSPANQARVISKTLALARRRHFHVNVIEAFDQPWKRALEGATGGHWGIFDRASGAPKFSLSGAVSDHPRWLLQALAGIVLAALSFAAALAANSSFPNTKGDFDEVESRHAKVVIAGLDPAIYAATTLAQRLPALNSDAPAWTAGSSPAVTSQRWFSTSGIRRGKNGISPGLWFRIAALSFPAAVLFGWTIETVPVESFNLGSWLRSLAFAATAAVAPVACAAACAAGRAPPAFSALLSPGRACRDWLQWALGGALIALTLLSVEAALGLVFDPRYRDIPFAPLSAAVVPFLVVTVSMPRVAGTRAMAETVAAITLAVSSGYVVFNETFANWQAVWFCAGLIILAFILARARDATG